MHVGISGFALPSELGIRPILALTLVAGGAGGSFVYLSTSPNGIRDATGNPTLLLVAGGQCTVFASPKGL